MLFVLAGREELVVEVGASPAVGEDGAAVVHEVGEAQLTRQLVQKVVVVR